MRNFPRPLHPKTRKLHTVAGHYNTARRCFPTQKRALSLSLRNKRSTAPGVPPTPVATQLLCNFYFGYLRPQRNKTETLEGAGFRRSRRDANLQHTVSSGHSSDQGCIFPGCPIEKPKKIFSGDRANTYYIGAFFRFFRTCRTAMLVEIPCTAKLSVKKPSLLIFAECLHIDDRPAKQLAAQNKANAQEV